MRKLLINFIPALASFGVLALVIFFVPYPESITQASIFQLLAFFVPLFLGVTFSANLFFKSYPSSVSISLGVSILLLLLSLNSLNLATAIITIVTVALLLSQFKTVKPKLRLSKPDNRSKLVHKLT